MGRRGVSAGSKPLRDLCEKNTLANRPQFWGLRNYASPELGAGGPPGKFLIKSVFVNKYYKE